MAFLEKSKPYLLMTSLQFGYAGMYIITKVSLSRGMSHFVLVVYRHAVATIILAPFALILERKTRPKITFRIFWEIFALGLLGPVLDINLYYIGLKLTSATFSCAMSNLLPAMTFVLALLFRMEKVNITHIRSLAKIAGTTLSVAGAMLMTFYKGPNVPMFWSTRSNGISHSASSSGEKEWIIGSLCLAAAALSWAALFILQASVIKRYSTQLSLTTLICFMGTIQSIAVTLAVEHDPSVWAIGFDMNLLTAVYSGIVNSGISYFVQGHCMQLKGPVFATSFSPLMLILVAIMDSSILRQSIYLGSVLGSLLIIGGLYGVLWGKLKEQPISKDTSSEMLPSWQSQSQSHGALPEVPNKLKDNEHISKTTSAV